MVKRNVAGWLAAGSMVGAVIAASDPPAATSRATRPAVTLEGDALDGAAPPSVAEAARSAAMAREMAAAGHAGHGMAHGTYRQTDAGREDVMPSSDPRAGHAPPPQPAPATGHDGHRGHHAPASPAPSPSPR
jgi:hypothetical protein